MEIIELKVIVSEESAKLSLNNIQALANKLQGTTIGLKFDVSGAEKVNRDLTAAINAQARLLEAKSREQKIQASVRIQAEKTATQMAKAEVEARKTQQIEQRRALLTEKIAEQYERAERAAAKTGTGTAGTAGTVAASAEETEIQRRINQVTGVSREPAWVSIKGLGEQVGVLDQKLLSGVDGVQRYIRSLDGMATASVKANGTTNRLGQEYQSFTATVKNSDGSFRTFEYAVDRSTGKMYEMGKGINSVNKAAVHAGDTFINLYLKIIKWAALTMIVYAPIRMLKQALKEMKAVDTEMVTIRKVTGASAAEMQELQRQAYKTAAAYGQVASDYLNSAAEFAKAGYKDLAAGLGELALKTKVVGDTDQATANQFLLSVDAAYKYKGSIESLERVLDGANQIGNEYATSVQKIAEGMGIVSSNAALAGISVDKLMAAIGTITAVTQRSGNEAARALRAVIMNIQGDVGALIDEESGEVVSEESVEAAKASLESMGIATRELKDGIMALRDPMAVIGDIAEKFKAGEITAKELTEVVTGLGGKLRSNQLSALIQNWDMYLGMLDTYAGSMGSADAEMSIYLDSWEAKTNQLSAAWTEFVAKTVDTQWIKDLVDVGIKLIDVGDELGVVLALILGLVVAFKAEQLVNFGGKLLLSIKAIGSAIKKVAGNVMALFDSTKRANLGFSGWLSIAGVGISLLSAWVMYSRQMKQAQKEARQADIEAGQAAEEENQRIRDLYKSYHDARDALDEGTGSKAGLEEATYSLLRALGYEDDTIRGLIDDYDALNDAIDTARINALTDSLNDLASARTSAKAEAEETLNNGTGFRQFFRFGAEHGDLAQDLVDKGIANGLNTEGSSFDPTTVGVYLSHEPGEDLEAYTERWKEFVDYMRKTPLVETSAFTDANTKLGELEQQIGQVKTATEEYNDALIELGLLTEIQNQGLPNTKAEYEALAGAAVTLVGANKDYTGSQTEAIEAVRRVASTMPELVQWVGNAAGATTALGGALGGLRTELDAFPGVLGKVQERYQLLAKAQGEMEESGYLSISTVSTLLEKYPELSEYLIATAEGYQLAGGALEDYLTAQRAEYQVSLHDAEQAAIACVNQESNKTLAFDATTDAIKRQLEHLRMLASARMTAVARSAPGDVSAASAAAWVVNDPRYQRAMAEFGAYDEALKELESAESALGAFDTISAMLGRESAEKDGKGKDKDPWKEEAEAKLAELRHLRAMELITNQEYYDKLTALDQKYFAGRKDYLADHRTLLEELFQLQRQIDQDWFNDQDAKAQLLTRQKAGVGEIEAVYQEMMDRAHTLAEAGRAAGLEEDSDYIQEMVDRWWTGYEAIKTLHDDKLEEMMEGYQDYVELHDYWQDWSTDSEVKTWKRALAELDAYYAKRGAKDENYYKWYDTLSRNYYEGVKAMWSELEDAVDDVLSDAKERMQDRVDAIDAEIDARKKAKDTERDQLDLEEKRLAVEKARKDLLDAENERTVRSLHGETWEWVADGGKIKDAREKSEEARKDLQEYEDELAYEAGIEELEAQKQAIKDEYEAFEDTWKGIKKSIEEPSRDMADILNDIAADGLPRMKGQIDSVVELLNSLSVGLRGVRLDGGPSGGMGAIGGSSMTGNSGKTISDYAKDYADARARGDADAMEAANRAANALREQMGQEAADASKDIDHIRNQGKGKTYDSGGVALGRGIMRKDTDQRESVLGPELTAAILEPTTSREFERFTKSLGILLGTAQQGSRPLVEGPSGTGTDSHDVNYYINGLQVPREAAEQMPLSEILRTLRLHVN